MSDESWVRLLMFFGVLAVMSIWQVVAPKRQLVQGYIRWPANLSIVMLDSLVVRLLIPAGAMGAALWAAENSWGLLNLVTLPFWAAVLIAVILLDLVIYAQHVLVHAVPLLWRLHMVHHSDRDIDVTTGLRFHPLEIIFSMLIKVSVVVLLGAPALAVLIFEVVLNGMAMFNHSNVRLPKAVDAIIRMLFVTPDMHRVHHSIIKRETNSNYGFNLSIWDRLFGTYIVQPEKGHQGMTIGLTQFLDQPAHQLIWMLRLPFCGDMGQYSTIKSGRVPEKGDSDA
ncbi:MAG: sterol desaturase family protein [Mariprofundaceae bacterium]|nr:sterol desaturase family protein [Mariprofundaceae bacterium]